MFAAMPCLNLKSLGLPPTGRVRYISMSITVALACLPLTMAGAQLRFRANSSHGNLWRHVYSRLPGPWKAHEIVYVREVSDEEMDRFVDQFEGPNDRTDSVVDGCYQIGGGAQGSAGQITLRRSLHGESAALVFTHEYGHFVWSAILTSEDRTRYQKIWNGQKRAHRLVTEYAAAGDEEGFAEAFAYFIQKPAHLRRTDERSWSFLSGIQGAPDTDVSGDSQP